MSAVHLQEVSFGVGIRESCDKIPMPSGVTAPRPVTTTLRIAFYDDLDDVLMNL